MERLTTRWCPYGYDTFDPIDIVDNEYSKANYEKILQRLGEYEDAEEQGLLLRLLCKIGDTIYKIPSDVNFKLNALSGMHNLNRVYEQNVHSIEVCDEEGRILYVTCEGMDSVLSTFYKETWFLTREEAESALERMKGEQHDL
jgi:hypothetical protein